MSRLLTTEDFHYVDLSFKSRLGFAKEIRDIFAACPPERAQNLHQIFGRTPFGPWLELTNTAQDPLLVYMFLQFEVDVLNAASEEMYFKVLGKHMRFGRLEFYLITGLLFGPTPSLPAISEGSFVRRLWPDHAPDHLKVKIVVQTMRGGMQYLSDEDVVRVCLVVMVEVMFMGRELNQLVSDTVLRAVDDLMTFDNYPWDSHIWTHTYNSLHLATARRHTQKNKHISKSMDLGDVSCLPSPFHQAHRQGH
ncbi:hypothetical protein L6452_13263 [Arctium lappa]|uniref:Uncharacterized protein n=1 Tax=Arctium lappa TaxID=4217 RepID=A0ACB9CHQ8_ARCLA|nr:hypothetical protein L6452_13263 [Arctium lappa]